jgi:hypothetical protein
MDKLEEEFLRGVDSGSIWGAIKFMAPVHVNTWT